MKSESEIKDKIKLFIDKQKENGYLKNAELGHLHALQWVLEPSTFGSNKTLN